MTDPMTDPMTERTTEHVRTSPALRSRVLPAIAVAACGLALSGCYERVVSSKGVGAKQEQQGYRSDTFLDRAYDDLTGANEKPPPPRPKVGPFRAR